MTYRNDELLDFLFSKVEQERRCLVPPDFAVQKALLRRVGESVVSPMPGLFARAGHWAKLDKAKRHGEIVRALVFKHSDWVFCSFSAACLVGLEVSWKHLDVVHVCSSFRPTTRKARFVQRHRIEPRDVRAIGGVFVTEALQTVADCLFSSGFADGMPIADSALARLGYEREQLNFAVEGNGNGVNRRARETARRVLQCADARAESGGESVARAAMIEMGFAPDHLQYELKDPFDGRRNMRCDYGWERMAKGLTLGELDGFVKYTNEDMLNGRTTAEALVDERQREARLSVYGYPLVRFNMRDVRAPGVLAHKLQVAGVRQSALPEWLGDIEL